MTSHYLRSSFASSPSVLSYSFLSYSFPCFPCFFFSILRFVLYSNIVSLMFIAQHVFDVNAKMKISTKPSHSSYRNALPLFWKIGRTSELRCNTIKKLVFRDYPVALYRGNDGTPIAISDICIHRGASLSQGKITPNYCLQCPYH